MILDYKIGFYKDLILDGFINSRKFHAKFLGQIIKSSTDFLSMEQGYVNAYVEQIEKRLEF